MWAFSFGGTGQQPQGTPVLIDRGSFRNIAKSAGVEKKHVLVLLLFSLIGQQGIVYCINIYPSSRAFTKIGGTAAPKFVSNGSNVSNDLGRLDKAIPESIPVEDFCRNFKHVTSDSCVIGIQKWSEVYVFSSSVSYSP